MRDLWCRIIIPQWTIWTSTTLTGNANTAKMVKTVNFNSGPLTYDTCPAEPKSTEDVAADEENSSRVTANLTDSITRLKRAAATAISAAAVKAKLLADHEEEQIRQLAALMIDKLVIWNPTRFTLRMVRSVLCASNDFCSFSHAVSESRGEGVFSHRSWTPGPENKRIHWKD